MTDYPEFSPIVTMQIITAVQSARDDPTWLDRAPSDWTEALKDAFRPTVVERALFTVDYRDLPEVGDVEGEVEKTLRELKGQGELMRERGASAADWAAYFRVKVALLGKLLGFKERAAKVNEVKEFEEAVIGILDDVLTEDLREEVAARLRAFA